MLRSEADALKISSTEVDHYKKSLNMGSRQYGNAVRNEHRLLQGHLVQKAAVRDSKED